VQSRPESLVHAYPKLGLASFNPPFSCSAQACLSSKTRCGKEGSQVSDLISFESIGLGCYFGLQERGSAPLPAHGSVPVRCTIHTEFFGGAAVGWPAGHTVASCCGLRRRVAAPLRRRYPAGSPARLPAAALRAHHLPPALLQGMPPCCLRPPPQSVRPASRPAFVNALVLTAALQRVRAVCAARSAPGFAPSTCLARCVPPGKGWIGGGRASGRCMSGGGGRARRGACRTVRPSASSARREGIESGRASCNLDGAPFRFISCARQRLPRPFLLAPFRGSRLITSSTNSPEEIRQQRPRLGGQGGVHLLLASRPLFLAW
jgi:hypothetical protein